MKSSSSWHEIAERVVATRVHGGFLPPETDVAALSRMVAFQAVIAANAINRMCEILEPLEEDWKQRHAA